MTTLARTACAAALLALVYVGCKSEEQPVEAPEAPPVSAWLEGTVTVSAEVDSTADYSGIQVLVVMPDDAGDLDTLGAATTDAAGRFATPITAPDRGIYPLLIRRRGRTFAQADLVVADGDTTMLQAELPVRTPRGVRLRSRENAAYDAYRNARAQHAATARGLLGSDIEALSTAQQQSASVLWSLRQSYPGTLGAELAAVEAVALLAGVDDRRAVAYASAVEPGGAAYVPTSRVARKAIGLSAGVDSAAAFLNRRRAASAEPVEAAAIQAELVQTYLEAERRDDALAAARALRDEYPGTPFAEWASRAEYEAEHLLPGLPAPAFTADSADGPITLANFAGRHVILEFYEPGPGYASVLPTLRALTEGAVGRLALVSVSLADPDRDALFAEGRTLPGHRVSAGAPDAELPKLYNVNVVPTRFLIAPDGTIVRKFVGASLPELQREAAARLRAEPAS